MSDLERQSKERFERIEERRKLNLADAQEGLDAVQGTTLQTRLAEHFKQLVEAFSDVRIVQEIENGRNQAARSEKAPDAS